MNNALTFDEKAKWINLDRLITSYFDSLQRIHESGGTDILWNPKKIKARIGPGAYSGLLANGGRKMGSSEVDVFKRVKQQPNLVAAVLLMTAAECKHFVPVDLVQSIIELDLPKLSWHLSKREKLETFIATQLVEGYYACAYTCSTNIILEGLVAQPTMTVRQIFDIPRNVNAAFQKAVVLLKWRPIPENGMECITTWITLKSRLYQLADRDPTTDGDVLRRHLPPVPAEGSFVNNFFLQLLFGSKYHSFTDTITIAPREEALQSLLAQLRPLLDGTGTEAASPHAIQKTLEPIQGDNYSNYVHPITGKLGVASKQILQAKLDCPSQNHIELERVEWNELMRFHKDWLHSVVDMGSFIQLESEIIGLTRKGRVLWILPTYTSWHARLVRPCFAGSRPSARYSWYKNFSWRAITPR